MLTTQQYFVCDHGSVTNLKTYQMNHLDFKWPKEPINVLSVFLSHNQVSANRLNFGEKKNT